MTPALSNQTRARPTGSANVSPANAADLVRAYRANELLNTHWNDPRLDAADVRRGFRRVLTAAGIGAAEWTPRELRHSFVSLLSDSGVTVDQIARLVGHAGGSSVTELVYRKQIRPVIDDGATAMNDLFPEEQR